MPRKARTPAPHLGKGQAPPLPRSAGKPPESRRNRARLGFLRPAFLRGQGFRPDRVKGFRYPRKGRLPRPCLRGRLVIGRAFLNVRPFSGSEGEPDFNRYAVAVSGRDRPALYFLRGRAAARFGFAAGAALPARIARKRSHLPPRGSLVPCSHFCRVRTLTPHARAACACESPAFARPFLICSAMVLFIARCWFLCLVVNGMNL